MSKQAFLQEVMYAHDKRATLVSVVSADPPAAVWAIVEALAGDPEQDFDETPVFSLSGWAGLEPLNEAAKSVAQRWLQGKPPSRFTEPDVLLPALRAAPCEAAIVWRGGADKWQGDMATWLWEVRDAMTAAKVTLFAVGPTPPTGPLAMDVLVIRHGLPDDNERAELVDTVCEANEVPLTATQRALAINTLRGLPGSAADKALKYAIRGGELVQSVLSSRWAEQLSGMPGVTVQPGIPRAWYGGNAGFVEYIQSYQGAGVSLVVQVDELEKCVPPMTGGLDSGVSASIGKALLTYMSDAKPSGVIFYGVPGVGKTLGAAMAAGAFGCPMIRISPSDMKASDGSVGVSEANARRTFGLIGAFGGVQLWIGTSNELVTVAEELKDRFFDGVAFGDVPADDELDTIVPANLLRYGLDGTGFDYRGKGYTGRCIEAICLGAIRRTKNGRQMTVAEAAAEHIPAAVRMARKIEEMRTAARTNAYRSARDWKPYTGPVIPARIEQTAVRDRAQSGAMPRTRITRVVQPKSPPTDGGEEF